MLRLPVQSYFVVLFSFHGTGTLFAGQEGEEWELFLFAVKNILNEVMLGCTYEADPDHGESHGLIIEPVSYTHLECDNRRCTGVGRIWIYERVSRGKTDA